MLRGFLVAAVLVAAAALAAFWFLTRPDTVAAEDLPAEHFANAENGRWAFLAGGCASCHAAPRAEGEDALRLGGGLELDTEFGIFRVPNISPDPRTGIGEWSEADFVAAMLNGVSPDGRHYYPAFPYTSYARMRVEDVLDLFAYLKTLPEVDNVVADHDLRFPYSFRRGLGLWKLAFLNDDPVLPVGEGADLARGRYLVEALGHCGECHTPRNFGGALDTAAWFAGAPNPDGEGRIPNITPHEDGIASWSEGDLVYYFETGFTPEFDSVGGSMAAVQRHLAQLGDEDRAAIAAYLKAVPPQPSG